MEKKFYSKVCAVASIKFVIDETRRNTHPQVNDRISCSLAASILTREGEVVAVRLVTSINECTVYISKNGTWRKEDHDYIEKIKGHLRSISKDAPMELRSALMGDDVGALSNDLMTYCSAKLEKRFEKLMKDVARDRNEEYIMSFKSFITNHSSIDVDNLNNAQRLVISRVCAEYYKKVKRSKTILESFLINVKKVGSYVASLINIVSCVCKEFHKGQVANLDVKKWSQRI